MEIKDLANDYEQLYALCLENWPEEVIKEAGNHRKQWYQRMKDKGVRARIAVNDEGKTEGIIQYIPIDYAPANGEDLYYINCMLMTGGEDGQSAFRDEGTGTALLEAAENDVRELGFKGIAAQGLPMPFWMRAYWARKHGYVRTGGIGLPGEGLIWKPLADDAVPPEPLKPRKRPERAPGKVTVTALISGWNMSQNLTFERARRAAEKFGRDVEFQTINTFERATLLEWGIPDGLFIDSMKVRIEPPPAYEKLRKILTIKVSRLKVGTNF